MKQVVIADNSGSDYVFRGIFSADKIDTVFQTFRDEVERLGEIKCQEETINTVDRLNKFEDALRDQIISDFSCTMVDEVENTITITRRRDGKFGVFAKGDSSSVSLMFGLRNADVGIKFKGPHSEFLIGVDEKVHYVDDNFLEKIREKLADVEPAQYFRPAPFRREEE